jgi:hypothetical protein
VTMPMLERYVRHAERFGVELVFETAAGLGAPFSTANVTVTSDPDRRVGLARSVTPTARKQRRSEPRNPGVGDFREVSARGSQLGPLEAAM